MGVLVNTSSVLFYLGVLTLAVVFARMADRGSKAFAMLSCAILVVPLGLRASTVGTDTKEYLSYFLTQGSYMEVGWNVLNRLCEPFGFGLLLGFVAVLTCGFTFARLWELRGAVSFPFSVFMYASMFYFYDYNIMRQALAISILFWGSRYLFMQKNMKFFFFVAFAMLFHKSACVGALVALFVSPFMKNDYSYEKRSVYSCLMLNLPLLAVVFFLAVYELYGSSGYFGNEGQDSLGLLISVLCQIAIIGSIAVFERHHVRANKAGLSFIMIGMIGLFLSLVGYVTHNFDRISLYYQFFGIAAGGFLFRLPSDNATLYKAALLVAPLGLLAYTLLTNRFEIIPYAIGQGW